MSPNYLTGASLTASAFSHAASHIPHYSLHVLHTRSEARSISADVITIVSSIAGVFIAIIGLVQGYRYWRRIRSTNNSSNAATTAGHNTPIPHNATHPSNLHVVTIDVNRVFLHLCTFYLSHTVFPANTGDHNLGVGNALSDIVAGNNGLAVPTQHSTIDEEERGVGPADTTRT